MVRSEGPPNVWNVWRITLCDHMGACAMQLDGTCRYAHSLKDLRPPYEIDQLYDCIWRDGVDRFYGQHMRADQLARIKRYWNTTPDCERPAWCRCLAWYHGNHDLDAYPHCSWDFGLSQDLQSLRVMRKVYRVPFQWAVREDRVRIWDLLYQRWYALRSPAVGN